MGVFKNSHNMQNKQIGREQAMNAGEVSDEVLMTAIAGGALWAMDALYERYARLLYSLAYRMISDHQVAEDLLQESFLSVWRNASSYSARSGAVHSWLFSIIHHRAIDYLRAIQRRATLNPVSLDAVNPEDYFDSSDTWEQVWTSYQQAQVRQAIMALSKEQRLVIELAYFQGWTQAEIAEGCHLPLGTVKARMRLGLLHLKRLLEQQGLQER
ncbi:DNA-directed RNA polymerase sigma-70 factor [Reticulibacter mediterranei]|uniref:RNA polymerase sigma factor n=2 Tax=Reticulibacter mediterranei TaxID=2778369 RepID=A0A8J3IKC2_9CHLR|nr:DNA-directed RNA polymerase sigma-70 factor [Reticulibacter mediterranei]